MFRWDIGEIRWKDNYKEKCCAVWLLQQGWMQSLRGLSAPVLTAYATLAVPPCAAVLQYSSHTSFARSTAPHTLPHSNPVPGVQAGPPGALWVLVTFASTFCHLLLPAPPWHLLCPDQGALHDFASCSCGLSDPRLSHMLRPKYSPNMHSHSVV